MSKLLSVVIPVFNVKEYVRECIDSVLRQDLPEIEIIIVDDGSTDGSGDICDSYLFDSRVTVIHKENGGLSSARNAGIDIAKGKYITFIDSDDYYLRKDGLKGVVDIMEKTDCDISIFSLTSITIRADGKMSPEYVVVPPTTIMERLFDDRVCFGKKVRYLNGIRFWACNKVFRRTLFNIIRFPEGKLFEDITTIYDLFGLSHRIVLINDCLYFYRIRQGSISTNYKYNEHSRDIINAIDYVMKEARLSGRVNQDKMSVGYAFYFLTYLNRAYISDINVKKDEERLVKFIRNNIRIIAGLRGMYLYRKFMVFIFGAVPGLYKIFYTRMKKMQWWLEAL